MSAISAAFIVSMRAASAREDEPNRDDNTDVMSDNFLCAVLLMNDDVLFNGV